MSDRQVGDEETGEETLDSTALPIDPDVLRELKGARTRFLTAFAQITLCLATTARYRHQTLADLSHLVLEPLMRDRVAIATARSDEGEHRGPLVGVAIWASVSKEVDAKIREQISAGAFPVRLKSDEWASGDVNWLLDLIAPTKRLRTAVLANVGQILRGGNVRIHPLVRRLVDDNVFKNTARSTADQDSGQKDDPTS